MEAEKVDVGDEVVITQGDWTGQRGKIEGKFDMTVASVVGEPKKALLTVRLTSGRSVQKNNTAVEPAPTPYR